MNLNAKDIGLVLKDRITSFETEPKVYEYGRVRTCGDGIVRVDGLSGSRYGELLEFEGDVYGMAMDLDIQGVGAVLLNGVNEVRTATPVRGTGRVVEVPVGDALLGRVVDPIGRPLDGMPLRVSQYRPIERPAPAIIDRKPVDRPLQTGILAIDSMIPIGRGQRELIIGDRQTGKTAIAIDAILNQKGKDCLCVYVAIGQKASTVAQVQQTLAEHGALDYTTLVVATASDCAAMQYIAPYAGCAIAEEFMYHGRDALVVYDDLSKHAVAYRAMSLLLRRPPGREAYPGDVFYLHSRLLERSAQLSDDLGAGSMTALPIIETMAGDISAYIPTNVISITDGQIFLETELFHSGMRPAVNVGLSVSRVGGSAQRKAMKKVASFLRLQLAQYRELAVFTQFGSDVDASTREQLEQGAHLTETLKQGRYQPYSLSQQVALLTAMRVGITKVPLSQVRTFNEELLRHLESIHGSLLRRVEVTGLLPDEDRAVLEQAIATYVRQHTEE